LDWRVEDSFLQSNTTNSLLAHFLQLFPQVGKITSSQRVQ